MKIGVRTSMTDFRKEPPIQVELTPQQARLIATAKGLATRMGHDHEWDAYGMQNNKTKEWHYYHVWGKCRRWKCRCYTHIELFKDKPGFVPFIKTDPVGPETGLLSQEKCHGTDETPPGWIDRTLSYNQLTREGLDKLLTIHEAATKAGLYGNEAKAMAAYIYARDSLANQDYAYDWKTLAAKYAKTGTFRKYMPKSVESFRRWIASGPRKYVRKSSYWDEDHGAFNM